MADDTVQIRYEPTGEVREVDASALHFFVNSERPGWSALKSNGAVNPNPATLTAKKD